MGKSKVQKRIDVSQRAFLRHPFFVKNWGKLGHNFCKKKERVRKMPRCERVRKRQSFGFQNEVFFESPCVNFFSILAGKEIEKTAEVFSLLKQLSNNQYRSFSLLFGCEKAIILEIML